MTGHPAPDVLELAEALATLTPTDVLGLSTACDALAELGDDFGRRELAGEAAVTLRRVAGQASGCPTVAEWSRTLSDTEWSHWLPRLSVALGVVGVVIAEAEPRGADT